MLAHTPWKSAYFTIFALVIWLGVRSCFHLNRVDSAEINQILIDAVLYDGQMTQDLDEAIRLINRSSDSIDISDWSLNDGWDTKSRLTAPLGTILPPNSTVWVAKEGAAFKRQFGYEPDWTAADWEGTWIGLANSGDEVVLFDEDDQIIDAVVYEKGQKGAGWSGDPLEPIKLNHSTAVEGQILYRKRLTDPNTPVPDTDTAADWAQDPNDPIHGRKPLYPGWDLDLFGTIPRYSTDSTITIGVAPDNGFEFVSSLIDEADVRLQIVSHTFENPAIADALIRAAERGVQVEILLEGGPPGGVSDTQKFLCQSLEAAGGLCLVMVNDDDQDISSRYRYIHAKTMIVDGQTVLVSSENLSPNSLPADQKADGTAGRRGVMLALTDAAVVDHFQLLWEHDTDMGTHLDIQPISSLGEVSADFEVSPPENPTTYTVKFPEPKSFSGLTHIEIIQSPETSLSISGGLLPVLNTAGAGDLILVQQQYEQTYWGSPENPNLRLDGYIEAARRGAEVWIMLDQFFDDPESPYGNTSTCHMVSEIAASESLALYCQLNNPAGLGIHNKMVVMRVGERGYSYIGSINGSESSHKESREVALLVQSNELQVYLSALFFEDWRTDLYLPMISSQSGPALTYPIISEVYYDPFGALDAEEFIELYNPSSQPIDLSGYSLSDALDPAEFADLKRFPPGTILGPGMVMVVTQQAARFSESFGLVPDFEILDSNAAVPGLIDDPAWGDPNQFIRLSNRGDVVILRDPADQIVDLVLYGDRLLAGVQGCEDIPSGHSLRRRPADVDTDHCSLDFESWPSPDPGRLP